MPCELADDAPALEAGGYWWSKGGGQVRTWGEEEEEGQTPRCRR